MRKDTNFHLQTNYFSQKSDLFLGVCGVNGVYGVNGIIGVIGVIRVIRVIRLLPIRCIPPFGMPSTNDSYYLASENSYLHPFYLRLEMINLKS